MITRRTWIAGVGATLAGWSDGASRPLYAARQADDNADAPAATQAIPVQKTTRTLATPRNDIAGAANLAAIDAALWRSAQPTALGFQNLKAMGIRTVVSLRRLSSDRPAMAGLGLGYVHIHFAPWHAEDEDVVRFLKVVSEPRNQPVLVHCQHGADRTGTMVAIYRAYAQGWPLPEAMQELPRFGFHSIWANLRRYLDQLDMAALASKVAAAPPATVALVP